MNINRHNYEEFFILYMDNELGLEERRQVEHFIQNHPDLKEELEGLLQYKLTPDMEVVFPGKDELLKGVGQSAVNLTNYKEWLLLYIDDELSVDEKVAVEQFIAGNDVAKKELSLLERTKLQPELVSFSGKKSLYRREERRIPMAWWRAAAAVIVLALGVTVLLLVTKKSGPSDEIVKTNPAKENNTTEKIIPVQPGKDRDNVIAKEQKNDPIVAPLVIEKEKQLVRPDANKDQNNIVVNNPVVKPKDKLPDNVIVPIKKEEQPVIATVKNEPSNNLPKPLNNTNPIKDAIVENKSDKPDGNNLSNPALTNTIVTSNNDRTSDIRTASFEDNGKKNKLRGFFRKITRTFEKRTNIEATTDDNKLLVAGLSINLK